MSRGAAAGRVRAGVLALGLSLAGSAMAAPAPDDAMARRVLACTGCHGPEGRAASDGYYPRIAGKPAGYLYEQLLAFRDGRRRYALMTQLLAPLGDAYLYEIAAHFAQLELPYPPPQRPSADAATLLRGETLVRQGDAAARVPACIACHGAALTGVAPVGSGGGEPAVPSLIGMPRDYLNAQLGAWRTGSRHARAPDCMAQVASRLAPADIHALSQWLAAQTVPAGAKPAAALPAAMPIACGVSPAPTGGAR